MTTPTPGDNEVKENNVNNLSALAGWLLDKAAREPSAAEQHMLREAAAALSALPAAGDSVWMFKDRQGQWCTFSSDKHRENTIASGEWEVRQFFTTPQPSAAECNCNPKGWRKSVAHGVPAYSLCECVVPPPDAAVGAQGEVEDLLLCLQRTTEVLEADERSVSAEFVKHAITLIRRLAAPAAVGAQGDGWLRTQLAELAGQAGDDDMREKLHGLAAALKPLSRPFVPATPAAGKGVDDAMVERFCAAFFTPKWPTSSMHNDNVLQDMVRTALEAALTRQPVAGDGK